MEAQLCRSCIDALPRGLRTWFVLPVRRRPSRDEPAVWRLASGCEPERERHVPVEPVGIRSCWVADGRGLAIVTGWDADGHELASATIVRGPDLGPARLWTQRMGWGMDAG